MSDSREKSLFLDAIEIESVEERRAFLMRKCEGDASLREAVERLISSHEKSTAFVDERSDPQERIQRQVQRAAEIFGLSRSRFEDQSESEFDLTGENIQNYRLMEKLGEGGFGQVYVAQQQSPVCRMVAMKLLKPGMESKEILARFEAERQALALMQHPNIAQVFDAGTSEQGQPYIVMELVRGVPLTDFCRKKQLAFRERLALFRDVCRAVHHAHQKGVIHRDLKPSNVLVTMHETTPVVKVIDFGVAKAIGDPLTDKTIYTRFAQLIGTPMYMSPEQAEMNAFDVDTRSDIYSLGVLLYELLTDTTPLEPARLQTASFDEMRRMIREEEPPCPSIRITTHAAEDDTTNQQASSARELAGQLKGDLDWIVMKSIEKDRRRRYETAADLSRDIDRFLTDLPVLARPPSRWYRFAKYARRNKLVLTTVSLVLLSLILGTTVSTWQAVRATLAQKEAERLKREAVDFAERLKGANVLLVSARANADQGRYSQAYREYTQATELSPDHYLTWAGRGSLLAELGAWQRAAGDYAIAMELGSPSNDPSWWGVPHLLCYAGETKHFQALREMLIERMDEFEDPIQVLMATRSICLKPVDEELAHELLERADSPVAFSPENFAFGGRGAGRQQPPPFFPGRMPPSSDFGDTIDYGRALVYYRAGEHVHARQIIERSLQRGNARGPGSSSASRHQLMALPLLALAYYQLGEPDLAEQILSKALSLHQQWLQGGSQIGRRAPWFDGLESVIILSEASLLIREQPLDRTLLWEVQNQALSQLE